MKVSTRSLWTTVSASVALATIGLVGARAGVTTTLVHAPYGSADHSAYMSCARGQVMPTCTGSSAADATRGSMSVSAAVDSGAGGTVPATVEAMALSQMSPSVAMGDATAATFTFHVHVTRVGVAADKAGRSDMVLWASALCDQCPVPYDQYAFPSGPGDQTMSVTLVRGTTGGRVASLNVGEYADARVTCDDFCVAPSGTARAAGEAILTGIEVKLWGKGAPSMPALVDPAAGSTVRPATFDRQCDTQCETFTGEKITGTAEPGMPVEVLDGDRVAGAGQADDAGHWVIYVSLSPQVHTLRARASGPEGVSISPPRTVSVTG